MSDPNECLSKFDSFLNTFFIRIKKGGLNANDFEKDDLEYIQDHLEDVLHLMTIEEAQRVNIYLHNAYIFHLNNGLKIPNTFVQRSLTPETGISQNDEEQSNLERLEKGEQSPEEVRHGTQLPAVDDFEIHSHQIDSDYPIETNNTGPLSQSTPLSVPFLPAEPRLLNVQQQEKQPVQNKFISDIVSHLNISPIPIESAPFRSLNIQPQAMSTPIVEKNEISFLRNFAHIEEEELLHEHSPLTKNIQRRTRKRPISQVILREPKKKMDKIEFDVLRCYQHKNRTDEQIKRSEESYLYFSLMRGKQTNITRQNNTEDDRRHSSLQRVHNLSNILRAHASQSHISVEQPIQMSLIRSPMTPQGLLRTSLSFTPLRGDLSGFEPRIVLDQATSFPTCSMQRLQPLLTIPERDSSIHIPLHPQGRETCETFTDLPREDLENVGMLEEQSLQIAFNDSSQRESPLKQIQLNSSIINIQPLTEHEPVSSVRVVDDQISDVPGLVSEDFEILREPLTSADSLIVDQQSRVINRRESFEDLNITTGAPTTLSDVRQEQVFSDQVYPMQLQQSIAQDGIDMPSDNPQFSWFEILRPRYGLVEYPREVPTNRRKKRKRRRRESTDYIIQSSRRHELTVIHSSGNINELAVATEGDFEQMRESQPSKRAEELNIVAEVGVSNQIIQNHENFVEEPPENPLTTPVQCSEEHGISQQVTQYPIPIETELKEYLELIKRAGRKLEFINWERFDSCLFNENDHFELYTNILKKIIKDDYVAMSALHEQGTSRIEAAKGFRFILDLKTMGLIEIKSSDTQILGIRLISAINIKKL